ncbi:hypothetical protein KKH43_02525 [Patescibacteria group bacterium]|nr:hypothetical protein [Patescibacteria group bacterium]
MEKRQSKSLKILSIALKVVICILPILLLFWILEKNFVFSGKRELVYDFSEDNALISHLEPWERLSPILEQDGIYFQKMHDDAVYFDLEKKDPFEKITVQITYKNPGATIFDLGLRINDKDNYKKLPLESKLLNTSDWNKVEGPEGTLYQKNNDFSSLEEFYTNYPNDKRILVYNFDITKYVPKEKIEPTLISPLRHNVDLEGIDYILAHYTPPDNVNGWTVAKNTFDYKNAYVDNKNTIRFMLAAPGLKEKDSEIEIAEIKITLEKEPLTFEKVITKARKFFKI